VSGFRRSQALAAPLEWRRVPLAATTRGWAIAGFGRCLADLMGGARFQITELLPRIICQFGDRWLQIRTKVVVTGKRGKVYETINPEAMKQAQDVRETNPTWTWSDKEPAE
jgi:hypothetical protein